MAFGVNGLSVSAVTLEDLSGCLRAAAAFAPVLLAPGYCLGWATNLLGFRKRPGGVRLVWSIALSFATMTIVSVLLAKYISLTAVCWLGALCGAMALWLILRDIWTGNILIKVSGVQVLGIGALWILFVAAELVDLGLGGRLFLSSTVYDHSLRTAFVDAVVRTGVPPANPLFWPGHAEPMRYYYFWYVLAAAVVKLGQVTARQSMIASVAWAGIGLAAIVTLFCWHFLRWPPVNRVHLRLTARRMRRVTVGIALLGVTGLDLLPVLAQAILHQPLDADMEWWSPDQVTSWMDTVLWVPHHVAGLVCCLFGFLLVWLSKRHGRIQRILCGCFAGCAFASAFGLSTWIAIAFAIVMLAWCVWVFRWEHLSRRRLPVLIGAALAACVLLTPYLMEMGRAGPREATPSVAAAPMQSSLPPNSVLARVQLRQNQLAEDAFGALKNVLTGASHLIHFGVRHMIDPSFMKQIPGFSELAESHPQVEDALAGILLLAPGYFAELGFYALILVAGFLGIRRYSLDEPARTALFLSVAALAVASLFRSAVVANNDFGFRSILIAQFFLLLLAVSWSEGTIGKTGRYRYTLMKWLLWIGLAGTVYQVFLLRVYLPVQEMLGRAPVAGLAEQAMALRVGFDKMNLSIPRDAVVQFNTTQPDEYVRYAQIMQIRRQVASSFPKCNIDFGGDRAACASVEEGITRLFAVADKSVNPGSTEPVALTAEAAQSECGKLGVSYLIAARWDNVWNDPTGWVWRLPAVVDTNEIRVLDCASAMR